jgi:hypothetical protein
VEGNSPRLWSILPKDGWLVAIAGVSLSPGNPAWRDGFIRFQERPAP